MTAAQSAPRKASDERRIGARRKASPAVLLRFERVLADLSARFISLPHGEVAAAIETALREVVEALDIDRSVVFRLHPETDVLESAHAWTRNGFPAARLGDLTHAFPWATARIRRGEPVVFSSVDELPAEASVDKCSYTRNGARSHVALPLAVGGKVVGGLTFSAFRSEREWPQDLLKRLQLVAEVLGNALARKQAQEDLEKLMAFERMTAEIAASLVPLRPATVDVAIDASLWRIADFLEVDRAVLWELAADRRSLSTTHFWTIDDAPAPTLINGRETPWMIEQLCGGAVLRLRCIDELPDEAASDLATLRALATVSMLAVPLRIAGAVVGALSLATVRARRDWPDTLVPRIQLLSDVFATVLSRQRFERRADEAQAEAAQHRERLAHLVRVHTAGEMSAGIAHEINQPLVAIENYALAARRHLASADGADPAKLAELLDKIVAQSSRAGDVIKHLRAMVRRHEFEVKRADLRRVVADSLRFATLEGQLRDVALDLRLPEERLDATIDEIQIQQVILNLARNAIEAMARASAASHRRLDVEVGRGPDQTIFVRVSDNGPGFGAADAERLFEPFYTTKGSGLGVGLSLCRTIVEAHGGRLRGWPGAAGGAVFEFTLPCADEAGA